MSAAYELNLQPTDAETFTFTVPIEDESGNPLTWANYTFEYVLSGNGTTIKLTEGAGITIDAVANALVIRTPDPTTRIAKGIYTHGLWITDDATQETDQIFDGTVTVSDGGYA